MTYFSFTKKSLCHICFVMFDHRRYLSCSNFFMFLLKTNNEKPKKTVPIQIFKYNTQHLDSN